MTAQILIVEDDGSLNQTLQLHFEEQGHQPSGVTTLRDARRSLSRHWPDLVLLDQHLPDGLGLQMLEEILSQQDDTAVVMMTGVHDLDLAIRAIKTGAFDFIYKPLQLDELTHVVAKALQHHALRGQVAALRADDNRTGVGSLLGQSKSMLAVVKEIALAASSPTRVLLTGETGTGKEVVARTLHFHSERKGLFMPVNCAAIVDTLMESELFGHERGAFTGANARKLGKFELANDGTLFLDEIGEMSLPLQAKLLRVLQEGTFERLGGTQTLTSRARIIAATNRDLEHEVQQGRFRQDLWYRLKTISIHLPPLRERREDIAVLADALLHRAAITLHKPQPRLTDQALARLRAYDWPGNIRELENVLIQASIHCRSPQLCAEDLQLPYPAAPRTELTTHHLPMPLLTLDEVESNHIRRVLEHTGNHKANACRILGISRPALDRKLRKLALDA